MSFPLGCSVQKLANLGQYYEKKVQDDRSLLVLSQETVHNWQHVEKITGLFKIHIGAPGYIMQFLNAEKM